MTHKYRGSKTMLAAAALVVAGVSAQAAETELFKKTPAPAGYDTMKDDWDTWPESENLFKVDVAPNIYMLAGAGGNITVLVGDDGVLLVDSGFPSKAIQEGRVIPAINALGKGKPVKYVINTHYHGDHTGGNEYFGKKGAIIIGGASINDGMAKEPTGPRPVPYSTWYQPIDPAGYAKITTDSTMTLRFADEFVRIIKLKKPGHSTSDIVVKFDKANVIATGDIYFKHYFIPLNTYTKFTPDYLIEEQQDVMKLMDDRTKVIPGHSLGEIVRKADVKVWNDMMVTLVGRVKEQIKAGKTVQETVAMNLAKDLEKDYAYWSYTGNQYVGSIYRLLTP